MEKRYYVSMFDVNSGEELFKSKLYKNKEYVECVFIEICFYCFFESETELDFDMVDFRIIEKKKYYNKDVYNMKQDENITENYNKDLANKFDNFCFHLISEIENKNKYSESTEYSLHSVIGLIKEMFNKNLFINIVTPTNKIEFINKKMNTEFVDLNMKLDDKFWIKNQVYLGLFFSLNQAENEEYYESATNILSFLKLNFTESLLNYKQDVLKLKKN